MRYDAEQKARTRAAVLKHAARAIRSEGPANIGVAGIMERAGLTHGGFYAHFASKDALVAEAVAEAFRDGGRLFERATARATPREMLAAYFTMYLSPLHRDARERGCPLPALAGDLPRLAHDVRETFAAGVTRLTSRIAGLLEAAEVPDAAALAPSVLAELVGALSLARAVGDRDQSDALLAASRNALKKRFGLENVPT